MDISAIINGLHDYIAHATLGVVQKSRMLYSGSLRVRIRPRVEWMIKRQLCGEYDVTFS